MLDKILLEIDKDIENPKKWVDFEECFDRLEKRLYGKKYKIKLSKTFEYTFFEIFFIDIIYNEKASIEKQKKIKEAINILKKYPKYKILNNYVYRKIVVDNRYLILYKIINNTVHIYYLIDGRQANKNFFKNLFKNSNKFNS